ncbi:MAG TPA: YHYH protein [Candidatus Saccharimonadales bacterium]|nr:YHYH protein [Candidatus Saccharimonadales bacterium]
MTAENQKQTDHTDHEPLPIKTVKSALQHSIRKYILWGCAALLVLGGGVGFWLNRQSNSPKNTNQQQTTETNQTSTPSEVAANSLTLDPAKNYGNKYANGILPVGDNNYSTASTKKGTVFLCRANFVPANQAGAQTRGPWFIGTAQWDMNKKTMVDGSIDWQERLSVTVKDGKRILDTNNLPNHKTGIYPVRSTDEAYKYDRNPGTISSQSLVYTLDANPTYSAAPNCMGGEVGIMLTGVALFNAFDAGGRDAGAWEVQDACGGHPQNTGLYHYHTLSRCIQDVSVSTVIGYALDGFPITGPKVGNSSILTTDDLDECHGITGSYTQDGKTITGYHYVMTQDFPYSVSCFRGKATTAPGQHRGGVSQQGGTGGQQQQVPPTTGQQAPSQGPASPPHNPPSPPM